MALKNINASILKYHQPFGQCVQKKLIMRNHDNSASKLSRAAIHHLFCVIGVQRHPALQTRACAYDQHQQVAVHGIFFDMLHALLKC